MDRCAGHVQARQPGIANPQCQQLHIGFHRHVKDRSHAGTDHLGVVRVHASGTQQAAQVSKPRQRAKNGAEIARILDLVQIDGLLILACSGGRQYGYESNDTLGCFRIRQLRHLTGLDHVSHERTAPVFVLPGQIQLAGQELGVVLSRLLQFQHEVLALNEVVTELLAIALLVQLLDVFELHPTSARATASATLIPSTPADRIPPAYPAPSPAGYKPRTLRLCSVSESRVIRTGDEVRVSVPVNTASGRSNPRIWRPNAGSASRIAVIAYSGNDSLKSPGFTPGLYDGCTSPHSREGAPRMKSPTNCPGAQ